MSPKRVGVLALQGGFQEHLSMLSAYPSDLVTPVDVRDATTLSTVDALIIPGGESTSIRLVSLWSNLLNELKTFSSEKPVWGVCAGMICLASKVQGDVASDLQTGLVGLMDITVSRNFFGRQSASAFRQMKLSSSAAGLSDTSHFIRAPAATHLGDGVQPLAWIDDVVVAASQSNNLVTAFHPEVSDDITWLHFFLKNVAQLLPDSSSLPLLPTVSINTIQDPLTLRNVSEGPIFGAPSVKIAMPRFLQGGVIMDVVNAEQARIAEAAGACSVMALERIPADIKKDGGVARMSDPKLIKDIISTVSIPVMAKARIGHFAEAAILQAIDVDCIDESEVLTPADETHHIRKSKFKIPFVCGAKNLGEALRRIAEGAAMIRLKGNAGTGNVLHAVRHARSVFAEIRQLQSLDEDEVYVFAKNHQAPLELVKLTRALGRLPVVTFAAGGIATPADVMLMMDLGCDGVFVGSGIFKGENSAKRARAMVEACSFYQNPEVVARVSESLGKGMVGILDDGETYNFVEDSKL